MLQIENRLKKVRDFNLVMKYGRWVSGQFFDIKVLELAKIDGFIPKNEDPNTFKKQLKLAFSIGLKLSKSAVVRNRLRRQVREVVRLMIKEGVVKNGYYVLLVAKTTAKEQDYANISQEIKLLFKRAGLLV